MDKTGKSKPSGLFFTFVSIGLLWLLIFSLLISRAILLKGFFGLGSKASEVKPGSRPSVNRLTVEPQEKPVSSGYLIEFTQEPSLRIQKRKYQINDLDRAGHLTILAEEHAKIKKDILTALNKKEFTLRAYEVRSDSVQILGEYTDVFNGLALAITPVEAEVLKTLPGIKGVYPNYQVKANLMDSVPITKADQVWRLRDDQGRALTGEGVTIGFLDSGIDYTHPDLGETPIEERDFEVVTTRPLDFPVQMDMETDQLFDLNYERIAYPSGNKIYIYDFVTRIRQEISLLEPNYRAYHTVLKDNFLAYTALSQDWEKAAIYFYDLETGEHIKINDLTQVSSLGIGSHKIVYEKETPGDLSLVNIYVYDLDTRIETAIDEPTRLMRLPRVSGDFVIYARWDDTVNLFSKAILINLVTGQKRELAPPRLSLIADFQGDQILYVGFDQISRWDAYYLYNIKTGSLTTLPIAILDRTTSFRDQGVGLSGIIYNGAITDDVVYYFNHETNRILAYDLIQKRAIKITLLKTASFFDAESDRVCFTSDDFQIYCHQYDPDYSYPLPDRLFNDKVVGGYNFVEDNNDPRDGYGHGTHTAAIAGGNGVLKGVAPGSKLVAYKILDDFGTGYQADILAALEKAAQTRLDLDPTNDIDILNLSFGLDCKLIFGGYTAECGPDDPVSRAVDNTADAGIAVIVSAGNLGGWGEGTISSPGTARQAITIGSTDKNVRMDPFSSQGPVIWNGETILKPDLVAPGTGFPGSPEASRLGICAAQYNNAFWNSKCLDDRHVSLSGTSMAAPHVAGVGALLKQKHPDWTPLAIRTALKSTARDLGQDVNIQGAGLVDALASIGAVVTPTPTSTPTPTPTPTATPRPTPTLVPTPTPTPPPRPVSRIYLQTLSGEDIPDGGQVLVDTKAYLCYQIYPAIETQITVETATGSASIINPLGTGNCLRGYFDLPFGEHRYVLRRRLGEELARTKVEVRLRLVE